MTFPIAKPELPASQAALELTTLHLQQAKELAGKDKELIPALLIALAVDRLTVFQNNNLK